MLTNNMVNLTTLENDLVIIMKSIIYYWNELLIVIVNWFVIWIVIWLNVFILNVIVKEWLIILIMFWNVLIN